MASVTSDRVDGLTTSVAIKAPVKCATTANITLSATQTIDGVSVTADDRVLVKNQTTASENGIYLVQSGAWSRARDFDGNRDVAQGTLIPVKQGTVNGNTVWRVTTSDSITIGTSSLAFELAQVFSGVEGNRYNFDSSTSMADPGSGDIRLNSATLSSVTAIAISDNTAEPGSPDISSYIATWDDSTTTVKGYVKIVEIGTPTNFAIYSLSSLTDNTGWTQLTVSHVASSGSFSDADRLSVIFTRNGDKGADGANGADGVFSAIASQAEAQAGTDNTKGMTPLRVFQAMETDQHILSTAVFL